MAYTGHHTLVGTLQIESESKIGKPRPRFFSQCSKNPLAGFSYVTGNVLVYVLCTGV